MTPIKTPKKLIEVALPLDAINKAAAREKSIRHGHPSTLHLWWARRPLAAARAVIFAQMVNDPGYERHLGRGVNKEKAALERERLFKIIEDLVKWENTNKETVLERARAEIRRSWRETCELNKNHPQAAELFNPDKLPAFHDPFAGGGALPLEAQRLGLESYASDLNPVAVTINKAMIEVPPRFAGLPPVNPESRMEWLGNSNALPRSDCLEKGNGRGEGGLSSSTIVAERGDLRNALSNNAGSGIRAGEHSGRLDSGIGQGESPLLGNSARFVGGDGDLSNSLRGDRLVPEGANADSSGVDDRGGKNANVHAAKVSRRSLTPISYSLFPRTWKGAEGLAEDVRRYGAWMREEAEKRIGHLYPKIEVTAEMAAERPDLKPLLGQKLTVIAWLWARTVKSPNPAFSHVDVPLASTFVLSSKAGKEAYVQPEILPPSPSGRGAGGEGHYRFTVKVGRPPESAKGGTTAGKRAAFICLLSKSPIDYNHIRNEGKAGRMGQRLMAIVAEGARGRVYLEPTAEHIAIAAGAKPVWSPEMELPNNPRDFKTPNYGLTKFGDLFTPRQLVALTTFSDLVAEAIEKCRQDALAAGMADTDTVRPELVEGQSTAGAVHGSTGSPRTDVGLDAGGSGATAYAQALGVYLAFSLSKLVDYATTLCRWFTERDSARSTFARQALPMSWDFTELNPIHNATGSIRNGIVWVAESLEPLGACNSQWQAQAVQADAVTQDITLNKVISTDPPYYDNIGYADLSDFFYVWLRKSLKLIFPGFYATLAVPKAEELVATPYRHGGKEQAEAFFLNGMTRAIHNLAEQAHPAFPVTIYYAFKQSETKDAAGTSSTGWETFLDAVLQAGFAITGTWPMRTELGNRMIGSGTNALASSIVLVCRKRLPDAPTVSRREFLRELNAVLPEALADMIGGDPSPQPLSQGARGYGRVAPVDLSQAIIGPGMAIFSQYAAVLEADGKPMRVKTALQLINRFLAEDDFDHDTQFCLHWFETQGWAEGKYGEADVLARAKGTSVGGLQAAGVAKSGGGRLRLLRWAEMPADWNPETDNRTPIWEALHQLIRALNQQGETAAGGLLARMPARAEPIRALAYRLYTLCERKGWAEEARAYNELVAAWLGIEQAAGEAGFVHTQMEIDL